MTYEEQLMFDRMTKHFSGQLRFWAEMMDDDNLGMNAQEALTFFADCLDQYEGLRLN